MENASLAISPPRAMKKFIGARLWEGTFRAPGEYIRSLKQALTDKIGERRL